MRAGERTVAPRRRSRVFCPPGGIARRVCVAIVVSRTLRLLHVFAASVSLASCTAVEPEGATLARRRGVALREGERVPNSPERAAVGAIAKPVVRGTPEFARLVRCDDPRVVFKDEERTGADRLMTPRLCDRLVHL